MCIKSCKKRCKGQQIIPYKYCPSHKIIYIGTNKIKVGLSHKCKALVLQCIDFRLVDDAVYFMNKIGYKNNYDNFILAGASLSINQKSWKETLIEHLKISVSLHEIQDIIIIDHIGCGYYKKIYGPLIPEDEEKLHLQNQRKFKDIFTKLFPNLNIQGYLMYLDGSVSKLL